MTCDQQLLHVLSKYSLKTSTSFLTYLLTLVYLQAQAANADTAATNAARAARFVSRATEQASQLLLSAANSTNTLPDIQWDSFPAAIRQQLLTLFHQKGWISTLGHPILQKQLPYERPMGLSQYHSFITNNPYYIAYWDEDFWVDQITPTPAHSPWLHPRQLQETLTEDQVLSLSAQLPAFQAVLEAAVAASVLPEQLLLEARQAAANSPASTIEVFIQHWVKQAGAAVSATAASILSRHKGARLVPIPPRRPSSLVSPLFGPLHNPPLTSGFTSGGADGVGRVEDFGDGSGGRCYGAITAVGSGDEGNRPGGLASVTPYGDAQQQSDLVGGAEGIQNADIAATYQDGTLGRVEWMVQSAAECLSV